MSSTANPSVPWHFWLVAVLALAWNGFGSYDYAMSMTRNEEYLAMFTPEQRAYFEGFPAWSIAAWAVGVWGGVAGAILLLLRSKYAITAFSASLAGVAIGFVYQFVFSNGVEIMGGEAIVISVAVGLIAVFLLLYAMGARKKGLLR